MRCAGCGEEAEVLATTWIRTPLGISTLRTHGRASCRYPALSSFSEQPATIIEEPKTKAQREEEKRREPDDR